MSALTLRLSDSLAQKISSLAAQQQISLSDFARNALENYVQQVQQELQLQEMIKAAQSLQQNPKLAQELKQQTAELESQNTRLEAESTEGWWR